MTLGVPEGGAWNGGISGRWWAFQALELGGWDPVIDLVLDRAVVGGVLADGGCVGPEGT